MQSKQPINGVDWPEQPEEPAQGNEGDVMRAI